VPSRPVAFLSSLLAVALLALTACASAPPEPELTDFEELPEAEDLYAEGVSLLEKRRVYLFGWLDLTPYQDAIDKFQEVVTTIRTASTRSSPSCASRTPTTTRSAGTRRSPTTGISASCTPSTSWSRIRSTGRPSATRRRAPATSAIRVRRARRSTPSTC